MMKEGYFSVWWGKLENGGHGAFLAFTAPDDSEKSDGIAIEDALPAECQGKAFDPDITLDFVKVLQLWLVPHAFFAGLGSKARGGTKDKPVRVEYPPVDLAHFGLVDEAGNIRPASLRALVRLVAPFWREEPELGLLHRLYADASDPDAIRRQLEAFFRNRGAFDPERLRANPFMQLMRALKPAMAGDRILSQDEIDRLVRWFRSSRVEGDKGADRMAARIDMIQLGFFDADGQLREDRALAARDFIEGWPGAPDYRALLAHLRQLEDAGALEKTDAGNSGYPGEAASRSIQGTSTPAGPLTRQQRRAMECARKKHRA